MRIIAPSRLCRIRQEAKPVSFSFATLGVGYAVHKSVERFRFSAGYEAVHVPFKGGVEALTEVIAGRVDCYFFPIATVLPLIRDGKLLALAVSSPARAALLPDVPTTLEAGFPNSDYTFWIGVFAPAKTPKDIVDKAQCGDRQIGADAGAEGQARRHGRADRRHVARPISTLW